MFPEVSIIMPCYNQAKYLPDALDSLVAQTFREWECIIVSDGSQDNVADIAKMYVEKDSRISFYDTKNGGPSAARNFGIEKALGTFILPLDGDDKISANYVQECLNAFKTENIQLAYGRGEKFGLVNERWDLPPWTFHDLLLHNRLQPCAMYRKTDCIAIGGYDERMRCGCEDWEFWIRLMKNGCVYKKIEDAVFYWRRKEVSRTTQITNEMNRWLNQYVYTKHAVLYEQMFNDPLDLYTKYTALKDDWEWANRNPWRFFLSGLKKKIRDSNF